MSENQDLVTLVLTREEALDLFLFCLQSHADETPACERALEKLAKVADRRGQNVDAA